MNHPQVEANNLIRTIISQNQGQMRILRYPARFNHEQLVNDKPAPLLGEDKNNILNSL